MNVSNRKLFVDRGARNRLAEMSGIMASSDDLMGEVQKFEQGGRVLMGAAGMPEPQSPGIMPLMMSSGHQQRAEALQAYMNPSFRTPESTGLEEFQQAQPISAEVSNQMRVVDMAKAGASVEEIAQNVGLTLLDTANIIAGTASLLVVEGAALAADVAGLVSGGGELSRGAFGVAQDLRDFGQDAYAPPEGSDNNAYRLFNQSGFPEEDPLVQIEEDSLRAIAAGDEALFAEGAPAEQLGGDLPSSIIEARIMDAPSIPDFGLESMAPFSDNRELNFDAPMGDTASESMLRPDLLERYDTSTGVPLTMDEVASSSFRDRISTASDESAVDRRMNADNSVVGFEEPNIAQPVDRFPQEDQRIAEQEAELFEIRNRSLSDNERKQMTPYEEPPIAMPNTAGAEAEIERIQAAKAGAAADEADEAVDRRMNADNSMAALEDIATQDGPAGQKSTKFSDVVISTATGQEVTLNSRDSVKAYEKLFSEMLGMDDKDSEKEVWHNMAMIGFAIAAGESPDALSNIANGLLAGTKMMKDDRTSAQQRKDEISMLALSEANEDRRLEARLRNARTVAGMRPSGSGTQAEPFVDAVRVLAQKGLDSGQYPSMEAALAAADKALRPYYFGTDQDDEKGGDTEEMVTVTQNGNTFTVPASQLEK